ncbi:MAG: ABC transporter permease [Pseudomonadales bacterium]|nr:ABC transporter permease [Pseudomonadales bacterium]
MIRIITALLRNTRDALWQPLRSALRQRSLLAVLVRREIRSRSSGTLLGGLWPLLQPALQVLGFWFLFDVIYGMRLNTGSSFLQYLLVGMLPWLCIAEVLTRASSMLLEFSPLYRRNPFPLELLPLLIMVIPTVVYGTIYFLFCLFLYGPAVALASLLIMPTLMLWLLPLCLLLPVLALFAKDFAQAVPFLLMVILYGTPVLYFPTMLPASAQFLLWLNPFADLMALIHGVVQGADVQALNLLRPFLVWLILLAPTWLLFRRSLPHVRELL